MEKKFQAFQHWQGETSGVFFFFKEWLYAHSFSPGEIRCEVGYEVYAVTKGLL